MTIIPIEKYQPSSGTERQSFFDAWCCRCSRDKAMREGVDLDECDNSELCPIIADTMRLTVDDPDYPEEWCYDANGNPVCTAFVEHLRKKSSRQRLNSFAANCYRSRRDSQTPRAAYRAALTECRVSGGRYALVWVGK